VLLWSVMAMKSRPASRARAESSATVRVPSLWTVCMCSPPLYQRAPRRIGSRGRADSLSAAFSAPDAAVSTVTSTSTPASATL
jgi:hypothetical protein